MSPVKAASGELLVTTTGVPPPTGVAVKVKLVQGPPLVGGDAVAVPLLGLVASANVSVGADGIGITKGRGAEAGVTSPARAVADTVTS